MGQHINGGHSGDSYAEGCYIPRAGNGGPVSVTVANLGTTGNLNYRVKASNDRDFATATIIGAQATTAAAAAGLAYQEYTPDYKHYSVEVKSVSAGVPVPYRVYGECQDLNVSFWKEH